MDGHTFGCLDMVFTCWTIPMIDDEIKTTKLSNKKVANQVSFLLKISL